MNRCDYLDPTLAWTGVKDTGRGCSLSKWGFLALTRRSRTTTASRPEPTLGNLAPPRHHLSDARSALTGFPVSGRREVDHGHRQPQQHDGGDDEPPQPHRQPRRPSSTSSSPAVPTSTSSRDRRWAGSTPTRPQRPVRLIELGHRRRVGPTEVGMQPACTHPICGANGFARRITIDPERASRSVRLHGITLATAACQRTGRVRHARVRPRRIGSRRSRCRGDPVVGPPRLRVVAGLACGGQVVQRIVLDEDTFTRAVERCVDDIRLEELPVGDRNHAQPAARIAREHSGGGISDIRDAILQQHEHLRAVIGAQPVTGAQVLIDPNVHHTPTNTSLNDHAPDVNSSIRRRRRQVSRSNRECSERGPEGDQRQHRDAHQRPDQRNLVGRSEGVEMADVIHEVEDLVRPMRSPRAFRLGASRQPTG